MWKVGQEVWCVLRGKGKVIRVDEDGVLVQFGTIYNQIRYDLQGRIGSNFNRSLFFSEPKVEGATKPPFEPTLKKGDRVIIRSKLAGTCSVLTIEEQRQDCLITEGNWKCELDKYEAYKVGEQ